MRKATLTPISCCRKLVVCRVVRRQKSIASAFSGVSSIFGEKRSGAVVVAAYNQNNEALKRAGFEGACFPFRAAAAIEETRSRMDNSSENKGAATAERKTLRDQQQQQQGTQAMPSPGSQLIRNGYSARLMAVAHVFTPMAQKRVGQPLLLRSSQSYFKRFFNPGRVVIPLNDLHGKDPRQFTEEEQLRCKLASLYRLVHLYDWTYSIYNHITARVGNELFLINPFGLDYHEITASSLVKIDLQGNVKDPGSTKHGINKAGFMLHSAIHAARPDARCVIHLHTPAAIAVSVMKWGLLPMSQEALILGPVSYHDYQGILVCEEEREALARSLGPTNRVMFLRNHGVVVCGLTIEETWFFTQNMMYACESQWRSMVAGFDNVVLPSEEAQRQVMKVVSSGGVDTSAKQWRLGELEYEALMRSLDRAGYRSGYVYRE